MSGEKHCLQMTFAIYRCIAKCFFHLLWSDNEIMTTAATFESNSSIILISQMPECMKFRGSEKATFCDYTKHKIQVIWNIFSCCWPESVQRCSTSVKVYYRHHISSKQTTVLEKLFTSDNQTQRSISQLMRNRFIVVSSV